MEANLVSNTTTDGQLLNASETAKGMAGGQRVLGRYRLEKVLGQGGMGIVWLANDEELDRQVALKFLPDLVINDRACLEDLKRETRRSLELTHPNIVRTYDFVQDSTMAGISMEYVDSDTLRNLRVDQPNGVFQPDQLTNWTKQLCDALDYAHTQAAIVHRDLKPANLMVNKKGQLKVADFGIARSLVESVSHVSMRQGVSGTLVYMSPQQLAGEPSSAQDDIYAVGATLYELFTTRPPFYTGDIAGQVHSKVPPSIKERRQALGIPAGEFPENWEKTIAACLSKDPMQRPRCAGEIAVRLGMADIASLTMRTGMQPVLPPPLPTAGGMGGSPGPSSSYYPAPQSGYITAPPTATLPLLAPDSIWHRKPVLYGALAAGVVVLLGLVAGVTWLTNGHSNSTDTTASTTPAPTTVAKAPATTAPAANAHGNLFVKTIPQDALVKVGTHPAAKNPGAFQDLPVGDYPVEVSLEGYEPVTVKASIAENKNTDLGTVSLVRSHGPLHVVTDPPGLTYEVKSLDDPTRVARGVTPLDATEMIAGKYEVTVNRDGWATQRQTVEVSSQQNPRVNFSFAGGTVTLTSDPAGAKVLANGKEIGTTPLNLTDVIPGTVQYTVQLNGYEKMTVEGIVQSGSALPLAATLKKNSTVAKSSGSRSSGSSNSGNSSGSSRQPSRSSRDSDEPQGSGVGHAMKEHFLNKFMGGGFGF